jgi:hypothetical protein
MLAKGGYSDKALMLITIHSAWPQKFFKNLNVGGNITTLSTSGILIKTKEILWELDK